MTPTLDAKKATGKIASMFRRLIEGAVRNSIEDLLKQPLNRLEDSQKRLGEGQKRLEDSLQRIDIHLDDTNSRIMALGARLDKRIDDLALQECRLIVEVAGPKRDQHLAAVVERRLSRIEDRVFAR